MILAAEVIEPTSYGFYYLATGLLGTGFVTMVVAIFVYFWKTQQVHAKFMQDTVVDNALIKRDVAQIFKELGDIKSTLKESAQHSPAALQEAVFELLERMKGLKK